MLRQLQALGLIVGANPGAVDFIGRLGETLKDQLADNLRPFIQVAVGPVMALDFLEDVGFNKSISKAQEHYSVTVRATLGANVRTTSRSFFVGHIGYSYARFSRELDDRTNFGGLVVYVGLGRWY